MLHRESFPDIGCFPRSPRLRQERWRHVNRRPDQDAQSSRYPNPQVPVCPHFQLIQICSDLVGTNLAEQERFCGQMGKYEDSIGILSGFRGTRYEPRSTCSEVHDALTRQMELMEHEVTINTAAVQKVRISAVTNEQLKPVIDKYVDRVHTRKRQDKTFLRWQQVIFDNCVVPARPATVGESKLPITIREEDPHFRRIESQSDLTLEEVVRRVKSFLIALREITGENPRFDRGALNCPQAPKREEIGSHS